MSVFEDILIDENGRHRWADISNVQWLVHYIIVDELKRAKIEFNLEPGSVTEIVLNRLMDRLG